MKNRIKLIFIFYFLFFLYKCYQPKLLLVLIMSNDTYCEDTTSHTYNFRLSILSSPPEGSTLVAIPEIYLKITYLNPLALWLTRNLSINQVSLTPCYFSRKAPELTYVHKLYDSEPRSYFKVPLHQLPNRWVLWNPTMLRYIPI